MQIEIGDLRGRRVLVTGGATGIGAAISHALANAGAKVAVHYHGGKAAAEERRSPASRFSASCAPPMDKMDPANRFRQRRFDLFQCHVSAP